MPCRVKIVFCEVKRMLLHVSRAPLLLVASFVLEYRTVALSICVCHVFVASLCHARLKCEFVLPCSFG